MRPIVDTLSGRLIDVTFWQLKNAPFPMADKLPQLEKSTEEDRLVQPWKAHAPTRVTWLNELKLTELKDVHP